MLKNIFNISDISKIDLEDILNNKRSNSSLNGKNIGLIFEKPSTRTRLSFITCINDLNANPIEIKYDDLNIARGESFEDTFKTLNCYLDGLIFRTTSHIKLIEASNFFKKPIINALSDVSHPCQVISDIYTIKEHFKTLKINILWMGDMNNVCFSLSQAVKMINDLNLTICCPSEISNKHSWDLGDKIKIIDNIENINLAKINCVMTDVFVSMNDKNSTEKEKLLKNFKVSKDIMEKTHGNSVFMHCLPAKVGSEVTSDVFNSPNSIVWKQATNRALVQRNILQKISWD